MLHCDASDVALGAELSQGGKPVAYFSKKLTPTETRYHVTDRELMAIYAACMKRHQYLHVGLIQRQFRRLGILSSF